MKEEYEWQYNIFKYSINILNNISISEDVSDKYGLFIDHLCQLMNISLNKLIPYSEFYPIILNLLKHNQIIIRRAITLYLLIPSWSIYEEVYDIVLNKIYLEL